MTLSPLSVFKMAFLLALALAGGAVDSANGRESRLALERATIISAKVAGPEQKAVEMFQQEIERRTTVQLPTVNQWIPGDAPVILLVSVDHMKDLALPEEWQTALPEPPNKSEGFAVKAGSINNRKAIFVVGRDDRGLLFGIGWLLRNMSLSTGSVNVSSDIAVETAPKMRWRGHQLGYRPKTNSYDGWDVADWEQYIRDLIVFGVNVIELVPPHSDDASTSPHFPLPPLRMMSEMSRLAGEYGIECWVWYPALEEDYTKPGVESKALSEWEDVFKSLPHLDAVMVPGGDPGKTPPGILMKLAEKQAALMRKYHPNAGMWVSPQGFSSQWLREWMAIVAGRPSWLTGVVYGPWMRMTLPEFRKQIPERYPMRLYPDITHSYLCQYPVPDWDSALASTLGREAINPRPKAMTEIFRSQAEWADGFISYSEGCNDDVNKAVWSALSWNPDVDVASVLREFSRYYIAPEFEYEFANGLFDLEGNWRGPLLTNETVETTLRVFQAMERSASPRVKHTWRFQQALYRAYFDAYIRRRLVTEMAQEQRALDLLGCASAMGSVAAMDKAKGVLCELSANPDLAALRVRIFQLAEALFQTAKMQLSVPLYGAIDVARGADLDTLDLPLNNRGWILERFEEIRAMTTESDRLLALRRIVEWTDPGSGGFYDDLGKASAQPHLVKGPQNGTDFEFRKSPLLTHTVRSGVAFENWRSSWWDHESAFYQSQVELAYEGLDPKAHYKVRVVYVPTFFPSEIRLEANEKIAVHPKINPGKLDPEKPPVPREFDIPTEATKGGKLSLKWSVDPDAGELTGFGQIGEVWLIRKDEEAGAAVDKSKQGGK